MGQLVFVGPGQSGGPLAYVLENLYQSSETFANYRPASAANFFGDAQTGFTTFVAFRMVQPGDGSTSNLLAIADSANPNPTGYVLKIGGTPGSSPGLEFTVTVAGATATISAPADGPLGRLIVMAVSHDAGRASAWDLYVNGLFVGATTKAWAAAVGATTLQVGANITWPSDQVEFLGMAFINAPLTEADHADVYVASQDAAELTLPASVQAQGTFAVYNAKNLTDITTWSPDAGSTITDDLLLNSTLAEAAPDVKGVPAHWAYSGWADLQPA